YRRHAQAPSRFPWNAAPSDNFPRREVPSSGGRGLTRKRVSDLPHSLPRHHPGGEAPPPLFGGLCIRGCSRLALFEPADEVGVEAGGFAAGAVKAGALGLGGAQ